MRAIVVNWQSSLAGVLQAIFLIGNQLTYAIDNVATTHPDWTVIAASLSLLWAGLVSRDATKTSEQSTGVKS